MGTVLSSIFGILSCDLREINLYTSCKERRSVFSSEIYRGGEYFLSYSVVCEVAAARSCRTVFRVSGTREMDFCVLLILLSSGMPASAGQVYFSGTEKTPQEHSMSCDSDGDFDRTTPSELGRMLTAKTRIVQLSNV